MKSALSKPLNILLVLVALVMLSSLAYGFLPPPSVFVDTFDGPTLNASNWNEYGNGTVIFAPIGYATLNGTALNGTGLPEKLVSVPSFAIAVADFVGNFSGVTNSSFGFRSQDGLNDLLFQTWTNGSMTIRSDAISQHDSANFVLVLPAGFNRFRIVWTLSYVTYLIGPLSGVLAVVRNQTSAIPLANMNLVLEVLHGAASFDSVSVGSLIAQTTDTITSTSVITNRTTTRVTNTTTSLKTQTQTTTTNTTTTTTSTGLSTAFSSTTTFPGTTSQTTFTTTTTTLPATSTFQSTVRSGTTVVQSTSTVSLTTTELETSTSIASISTESVTKTEEATVQALFAGPVPVFVVIAAVAAPISAIMGVGLLPLVRRKYFGSKHTPGPASTTTTHLSEKWSASDQAASEAVSKSMQLDEHNLPEGAFPGQLSALKTQLLRAAELLPKSNGHSSEKAEIEKPTGESPN